MITELESDQIVCPFLPGRSQWILVIKGLNVPKKLLMNITKVFQFNLVANNEV